MILPTRPVNGAETAALADATRLCRALVVTLTYGHGYGLAELASWSCPGLAGWGGEKARFATGRPVNRTCAIGEGRRSALCTPPPTRDQTLCLSIPCMVSQLTKALNQPVLVVSLGYMPKP